MKLTKEQMIALKEVYDREWNKPDSYLTFRRTVLPEPFGDAAMVPFVNMWLGIEPDGYTHS
jgi:hypothetical protein|tara:strand:+ start:423 stop:605 length:183 start_codon:yes stop_codon:yes gene_type:complete